MNKKIEINKTKEHNYIQRCKQEIFFIYFNLSSFIHLKKEKKKIYIHCISIFIILC